MLGVGINYVMVFLAAVVHMIIGMIWYSPIGFLKLWMKLTGVEEMKGAKKSMAIGFVSSLVLSFVLAHVVMYTQAASILEGMVVGFLMWLGFIATTTLGVVLWEGKPLKLYFLNNGYHLVTLVIMGGILAF